MRAIAAMSRNRVVGQGDRIPWRIREEFQWFRRMTLGRVVIMGRRTFESLPKPLDGRITVVLTRHPGCALPDEALEQLNPPSTPRTEVHFASGMDALLRSGVADEAWLCGGVQLYEQFLGLCSDLYLSVIERDVEGDAFFPAFEHLFDCAGVVHEHPEFKVLHYVRTGAPAREPPRGDAG